MMASERAEIAIGMYMHRRSSNKYNTTQKGLYLDNLH
jgi:hypothetical protein